MSVNAHRTTGAHTTEPGHLYGEFVNDVRVSPIDEGVGDVEEDELCRAVRRVRTGSPRKPGENDSACVQNFTYQERTICSTPHSSHDDTSDDVPKLHLKIGSVRGLMKATPLQRIPRSTMNAQLVGTKHSRVLSNAPKTWRSLAVQRGVLLCDFRVQ